MKKQEVVYRKIACEHIEGKRKFTQLELASVLGFSLSTINNAINNLEEINSVKVNKRSFEVMSLTRLLLYWATRRRLEEDVAYRTRVEAPVREIEAGMPESIAYTCYTAYKLLYKDVPADYSEVYVYATEEGMSEIKSRFRAREGPPNLMVLKADQEMADAIAGKKLRHSSVCNAQVFVDLWNLNAWYAKDFIGALEKRLSI